MLTLAQLEAAAAMHACMSALEAHLGPKSEAAPPKMLIMDEYWFFMNAPGPHGGPSGLETLLSSFGSRSRLKSHLIRIDLVAWGDS